MVMVQLRASARLTKVALAVCTLMAANAWAADQVYADRVLEGGNLPMDIDSGYGEPIGDRAKGLPRNFSVEIRSQQESSEFIRRSSRWVVGRGSMETLNYGTFSFDGAFDLVSSDDSVGYQSGAQRGSFSLYQRGMPLGNGLSLSNTLGTQMAPIGGIASQQYRFGLPTRAIFGLTSDVGALDESVRARISVGETVAPASLSQAGLITLGGKLAQGSIERQWKSLDGIWTFDYAAMASAHRAGDTDIYGWGIRSVDSDGLFQAVRAKTATSGLQLNVLNSRNAGQGLKTGWWADGYWAPSDGTSPTEHRFGLNHFSKEQNWLGTQVSSPSIGGYYRWRWQTPLNTFDVQVDRQRMDYGTHTQNLTQVFAHGRQVVAPGIAWGAQFTGFSAQDKNASTLIYRDQYLGDRSWKIFAGKSTNSSDSTQFGVDFSDSWREMVRWNMAGALTWDKGTGQAGTDLAVGVSTLSGPLTFSANLRRYTLPGGSTAGMNANLGMNWRIGNGWSMNAAVAHTTGAVITHQLGPQNAPPPIFNFMNSTPRQNIAWISLRYEFSAGRSSAPIGGAVGSGGGSVEGTVFLDDNGNGRMDGTEKPAANVAVMMDGRWVTRSDANGRYEFPFVAAGMHRITVASESLPLPWSFENSGQSIEVERRAVHRIDVGAKRL